jgi:CRISPR system Cascade subunit CasE
MLLHRIHLDLRCKEVRRDLADPYQMHSTLCRAFSPPEKNVSPGEFLWRLEPETDSKGNARLILQSRSVPEWSRIEFAGYFHGTPDPPLDFFTRLGLDKGQAGKVFRFRLRANPCITRAGKRLGLMQLEEQLSWLKRKGESHGFEVQGVQTSEDKMLTGQRRNSSDSLRIFSVLFDGMLKIKEPEPFREAVTKGIGHGKAFGLGLLSIIPIREG